ncbi:MAG: hypothetical protein HZC42_03715 [Candidatus Eisenbacteria bacterium]|nr:hypothetical protein [Candidatus Eisenbacteria bacterium]
MPEPRVPVTGRLIFGLFVIVMGVLFTLDNLGLADAGEILRWWPLALIAYGVARLSGFCCRQSAVPGALFTLVGAWLLLHSLGYVRLGFGDLWPLVLVGLGAAMVGGALRRSRIAAAGGVPGEDISSTLSAFALWSGSVRKVVSQEFRGGDVTAVMGGHEIDLRAAKMPAGSAVIDLLVWWGGVEIRVPEDWRVSNEAFPFMGGIEDATKAPAGEVRGTLVLKGLIVMGGVEVKN